MNNQPDDIKSLNDLNRYRTAPFLLDETREKFLKDLNILISQSDWLTVGVMAKSSQTAISVITGISKYYNWENMNKVSILSKDGPVYLKANQKTGDIYLRVEHGLGEGILFCCHHDDNSLDSITLGPLPLDFFL